MDDYEYFEALIVKHLDKETSPAEGADLQKWLDTDPLRRQEYLDLEKIWKESGPALEGQLFDKEAAWKKMQPAMRASSPNRKTVPIAATNFGKKTSEKEIKSGRKDNSISYGVENWVRIKNLLAAASVLLIVLFSGWWYYSIRDTGVSRIIHAENADQQVRLPDGTLAWLRRGATLQYPKSFNKKERLVEMSGEVFFEVVHNTDIPFSVKTSHVLIEDIGTSFKVKARESFDEIIVATGKVRITEKGKAANSLVLAEGEKAQLKEGRFIRSASSVPNSFSWKTGILDFRDTPLDLALEEIGDFYRVGVKIPEALKADAGHIRLTARFEKQPLREILEEIRLATGSQIRQDKDTLFLLHP